MGKQANPSRRKFIMCAGATRSNMRLALNCRAAQARSHANLPSRLAGRASKMDTQTVRIFLTGKIEPGQEIKWNMAPLPHPEGSRVDPIDAAADLAFDAPCTISFF